VKERLTPKQRLLLAMTNQVPDRVPCTPDISNMVPARLTGKTFEHVYLHHNPPLGEAYLRAVEQLDLDGWWPNWEPRRITDTAGQIDLQVRLEHRSDGAIDEHKRVVTPAGELTQTLRYFPDNPPAMTEKPIKDLAADLPAWKAWQGELVDIDAGDFAEAYARAGDRCISGTCVLPGGLQNLEMYLHGGIEEASVMALERPELVDEWMDHHNRNTLRLVEMLLDRCEPPMDFLLIGASGLGMFNTEDQLRRWVLPGVQDITRICKQAGVPTMLHSCGRARKLVQILADETDLDCFNPLEKPPMGNCVLSEVKQALGEKISLMGNLHTTDVMLRGTAEQVRAAAREAIADAGANGGFILSTGDQCGRDTPLDNFAAMLEVCRNEGRYD